MPFMNEAPTLAGLHAAMGKTPAATPAPAAPAAASSFTPSTAGAPPGGSRPQFTPAQFTYFADLIYKLSGMKFESSKSYFLASKISNRMELLAIKDFDGYKAYLEGANGRTEHPLLVDEVTINETFFYRHEPQLQGFMREVMGPLVLARKHQNKKTIRILSAAASTGDELYTIALMLKDAGHLSQGLNFELIGIDISHEALKKAREGIYKKYNVRNIPPAVLQQNFTSGANDTFVLKSDVKSMCRFHEMNLMDNARMKSLGQFDVIFVRNVLIYFDETSKEQVVKNLCDILLDDGVVIMGHSENIYSQRHLLRADRDRPASLAHIKAPPGTPKL